MIKPRFLFLISLTIGIALVLFFNIDSTLAKADLNVHHVTRQDITLEIEETGYIKAKKSQIIFAPSTGVLTSINVSVGQEVKKGDILASINSETLTLKKEIIQKKIKVLTEKISTLDTLIKAKQKRSRKSHNLELNLLKAERKLILAEKDVIESELKMTNLELARLTIKADFSGLISDRFLHEGAIVKGGTPLFSLIDQKNPLVECFLPEHLSHQIKEDQNVSLSHDYFKGDDISASISRIYPEIIVKKGSRLLRVLVTPKQDLPRSFKPGNRLAVKIPLQEQKNTLSLPLHMIQGQNGHYFVWTLHDDKKVKQAIKLGLSNHNRTEILSGLSESDRVLYD